MQFQFGSTIIRVTHADDAAMLSALRDKMTARQGFALATINLDHLVKLRGSTAFRRAYAAQDVVVADGNPVVWLSRLAGRPVRLVPGSDMVVPLARVAAQTGTPVALVGSSPAALDLAAARLLADIPGLIITHRIAPAYGFDPGGDEAADILQRLHQTGTGLAFVALGAPKQEMFAARGRQLAPQTGFASVGAGLDFLAGTQTRAPAFFRAFALEWVWRAGSSPRRMIPRYAACARVLPAEVLAALRMRRQS